MSLIHAQNYINIPIYFQFSFSRLPIQSDEFIAIIIITTTITIIRQDFLNNIPLIKATKVYNFMFIMQFTITTINIIKFILIKGLDSQLNNFKLIIMDKFSFEIHYFINFQFFPMNFYN